MKALSLSICLIASVVTSVFSYGLPSHRGYGSICQTEVDCHIENSTCIQGKCECLSGFIVDGSLTKCLQVAIGYYDTCEESVQCSKFLGAGGTCDHDGRCVCIDGYHYLHGQCHETKGLSEKCSEDVECFVNTDYHAASCENGICKCNVGFYQREYSTCRPKAEKEGDECFMDLDCQFNENAKCVKNQCSLGKKEIMKDLERIVKEKEESTLPNEYKLIIGESKCNIDADCKLIANSICSVANHTCVCDRGYFATAKNANKPTFQDGCAPEIGTSCDPDVKNDFAVSGASCKNNEWTCNIDKVTLKDNQLCRKYVEKIDATKCQYPEQCQLFGPHAICVDEKCECNDKSHWVEKEKFCWETRKIGEICRSSNDCYSRGGEDRPTCDLNLCKCPEGSIAGKDGGYCYSEVPELGSYCEEDSECAKISNSNCENKACACAKTYFKLDNKCVAGLNASCENDDDCKRENSKCYAINEKKTCQCSENFTVGPDNICIEKSHYKKNCTYDAQCSAAVKNTFCNMTTVEEENEKNYDDNEELTSGHCECIAEYYYKEGSCYRKRYLGQECSYEGECFATNSVCKNGICSCKFDFVEAGKECKSKNASSGQLHFYSWLVFVIPVTAILMAIP